MRKLKASLFAGMLVTSSFLAACGGQGEPEENVQEEVVEEEVDALEVFTTLFPLEDFTNKIGGEYVNVTNIIPVGADAHTYEPTAREMISVAEGDMFIYNGAGMEGFADAIIDTVTNENVLVVKAIEGIELIDYDHDHDHGHDHDDHGHEHDDHGHEHDDHGHEHDEHGHEHDDHGHEHDDHGHEHDEHGHEHDEHGHEHDEHGHEHDEHGHEHDEHGHEHDDHGHDHHHGDEDPHVWLDPILAIQMAENIKNGLIQLLPEQQEVFEANFNDVKTELEAIDAEFSAMVEEVEKDTFIVSHAGFGYWENRYGIHQIGITGLSPTNEPTRKQLEQIIEFAEKHNIQHVAFEQNFTSQVAEVVKEEVGAEPVYIHNLEVLVQEDIDNNEDYFSLMRKNIESLRTALQ
ncbi:metal ABC transporter solute-binding protein, Zn/Mn family [Alkalihalobacterium chitinilyticum]|uniref:Zinc ABC transporter substrate-binding protein n=1 Tax=Alkalihalobacterium chitinilyticum TaxID=2980103 RepID=A0ABT5V9S8_9BACI|nr:zinc ABC transporter substrate-binding protein [Alkalihalobacterium chitinilyticum]MDE5412218.1 zinc ABC transporter substrate-binding protein [Alkalihalobacterium chitinilyticum]